MGRTLPCGGRFHQSLTDSAQIWPNPHQVWSNPTQLGTKLMLAWSSLSPKLLEPDRTHANTWSNLRPDANCSKFGRIRPRPAQTWSKSLQTWFGRIWQVGPNAGQICSNRTGLGWISSTWPTSGQIWQKHWPICRNIENHLRCQRNVRLGQ